MPSLPPTFAEDVINQPARAQFEAFLDEHRSELNRCLDGLTKEQARQSLVPSRTTLLGLVKHATFVEKVWFDEAVTCRSRAEIGIPATSDESFILHDDDTIAGVQQAHREACESSRMAIASSLPRRHTSNHAAPAYARDAHPAERYGLRQATCTGQHITTSALADATADQDGNLTIVAEQHSGRRVGRGVPVGGRHGAGRRTRAAARQGRHNVWGRTDLLSGPVASICRGSRAVEMSDNAETAVLAGGCAWTMQQLLRHPEGVISTRTGFMGGENDDPTEETTSVTPRSLK